MSAEIGPTTSPPAVLPELTTGSTGDAVIPIPAETSLLKELDEMSDSEYDEVHQLLKAKTARIELERLMKEARKKGIYNQVKAELFKIVNVVFIIFIVFLASTSFVIGLIKTSREEETDSLSIVINILTGVTLAFVTIHGTLGLGSRGTYYKQVSIRLRGIFRTARNGIVEFDSSDAALEFAKSSLEEMDKMDLNIYNMGSGPADIGNLARV